MLYRITELGRFGPLSIASKAASRFPLHAFTQQDHVFGRAFDVLVQAIAEQSFPAASVAVTHLGKMVALKALGTLTYGEESPPVNIDSVFDLASVSKVVATTTAAMILYQRGLLDLDAPVVAVVPEFGRNDPRRREVTFRMLLAHSSGLPAHEKLYLRVQTKATLLEEAFMVPLQAAPMTRAEYSDIGFMVLGAALERIADEPLDTFCQREVFGPLGMAHTTFNPPTPWHHRIPPTAEDQTFRMRMIQGEVQDENASVLGGVAGHAGVFAKAGDVAIFAHALLNGGFPLARAETLALFVQRQSLPEGTSRALGWDTPSAPSQSGKYFSDQAYGHLGYTGTSLWIDPARQLSITLLTNRTWPDAKNQAIKQVRPQFHDAVVEALEKNA